MITDNNTYIMLDKKTRIPIRQNISNSGENQEMTKIQFIETEFNCVNTKDIENNYDK